MNRKLIILTLGALISGGLLGHTGKLLKGKANPATKNTSAYHPSTPPSRSGEPPSASSHSISRSSAKPENKVKLDTALKRYARMTPEELWQEREKLEPMDDTAYHRTQDIEDKILLFSICTRLGHEFPRQTLQQIEKKKKNSDAAFGYSISIFNAWASKNPEAVLTYCKDNMGNDDQKNRFLTSRYLAVQTSLSPEKALDYVTALPTKEQFLHLHEPLTQLAEKTPEKIAEIIQKIEPALQNSPWTQASMARIWAKHDWNAAIQWISSQPEEKRNLLMGSAVSSLSLDESEDKLTTTQGTLKEKMCVHIVSNLWKKSPQQAVEWLGSHATEEEAAKIISNNYYNASYPDSDFATYIDQMPVGVIKDSLLERMANDISPNHSDFVFMDMKMEDSVSAANKINSQEKRIQVLDRTLNFWIFRNPQSTKAWIEKSNMPAEKKATYLKRCDTFIKEQKTASDPNINF